MTNFDIMAVVKPAVCSQLKCPASALFPVELISIVGDDYRGYQINGYVDSQNSYGAMCRNDFTATVTVENGYPVVRYVSVGVQANKQAAKTFATNYIAISILVGAVGLISFLVMYAAIGF